jgi:hypothetical protein
MTCYNVIHVYANLFCLLVYIFVSYQVICDYRSSKFSMP